MKKITEDNSEYSEEIRKAKLVKKVIETTRCTAGEAEIALHDNEWDLNTAVMTIIERPNNSDDWMEKKGRKVKKQENVKNTRRFDNRNGGNRGPRPQGGNNGGKNDGQNIRKDRPPRNAGESRPNRNYKKDNKTALDDQKFPAIDSFDSNTISKEDNTWKNGPLIFEASSVQQQQPENQPPTQPELNGPAPAAQQASIYMSSGGSRTITDSQRPLSFAAVAAAKKQPLPAPVPNYTQSQKSTVPVEKSNHEQSQPQIQQSPQSTSTHFNDHHLNKSLESPSIPVSQFQHSYGASVSHKDSPPNSIASTSMGMANLNINKEYTDKLKSDIGLVSSASNVIGTSFDASKIHSDPSVTLINRTVIRNPPYVEDIGMNQPISHSSLQNVEFVSGDMPSMTDFQFGFHASSPVVTSQQSQLQHQQTAAVNNSQLQNQHDQYSADIQRQQQSRQRGDLSMVNNNNVDIPNDLRHQTQPQNSNLNNNALGNKAPNSTQQQVSQQPTSQQQQPSNNLLQQQLSQPQQQHPSLQQQQHQMYTAAAAAQFSNFPYPYLYSPVTPRDVDQYATMAPFPYNLNGMGGMNQLDMSMGAMLPPALASTGVNPQGGTLAQLSSQPNHHQSQQSNQTQQAPPSSQHRSSVSESKYPSNTGGNVTQSNTNLPYQNLGTLNNQSTHPRNQSGVVSGLDNSSINNGGSNGVAPPPGFSGPQFLTQPSFQSLFQMPSYAHPFPLLYPNANPQQRQPTNHQAALIQQQRPSEHNPYMDLNKYSQQNNIGTTQSNIIPQSVNPSYQGLGSNNGGNNQQQQHQRSINQNVSTAGAMIDNGQYWRHTNWRNSNN